MRITSAAALLLSAFAILGAAATNGETPAVVGRLLPSENGYERVEIKTGAAFWKKIEKMTGEGSVSIKEKSITAFRAEDGGCVIFTAARGMHGPVYMAVAVVREQSAKGDDAGRFRILGAEILKHDEVGGARAMEDDFLSKFRGRYLDGFSARGAKADAVSGATISSRAVVEGMKKALAIAEFAFKKTAER
jgi:Na+-translocating ferredoxin:NAD+ oxidoreductase RnfG subunit